MAVRVEASTAGRAGAGALQVAPPSVDLLRTAARWQPALVWIGHRPPLSLIWVDQVAYSVPSGATAAAGKLLTRNTAPLGEMMGCTSAMATGWLQLTPPSVDLTTKALGRTARRVEP